MAERGSISGIVMFLAIIMLFASFIGGSSTAWTSLTGTLSSGPALPTWGNPYALQSANLTLGVVGNGTEFPAQAPYGSGNGCASGPYYKCVQTLDDVNSFVLMSGIGYPPGISWGGYEMSFALGNITGVDLNHQIISMTLRMECASNSGTISTVATFQSKHPGLPLQYDGFRYGLLNQGAGCAYGGVMPYGHWTNTTFYGSYQNGLALSQIKLTNISGAQVYIQTQVWSHTLAISYLSLDVEYLNDRSAANPQCGSLDIGCVVNNAVNTVTDIISFIVNGAIYVITYVAAWLIFLVSVITGVIIGTFTSLAWMMNPANTGAPPVVQGIIDIFIFGMFAYLLIKIISLARGVGE